MEIGLSLKKDLFKNVSLYPHCLLIIKMVIFQKVYYIEEYKYKYKL